MRIIYALILALCLALPAQASRYHVGDRAADIIGRDALSNEVVSLSDYSGRWVFLDFWATWCGPCMHELPNLLSSTRELRDAGQLEIFSVSLDHTGSADAILPTVREMGIDYPVLYDGGGWDTVQSKEWGIRSIPATYLIDPQGTIVATGLRGDELLPGLEYFISGKAARAPFGLRSSAVTNDDGSVSLRIEAYSPDRQPVKCQLDYYHMRYTWAEDDPEHLGKPVSREAIHEDEENPEQNFELSFGDFGDASEIVIIPAVAGSSRLSYRLTVRLPGTESLLKGRGLWIAESGMIDLEDKP